MHNENYGNDVSWCEYGLPFFVSHTFNSAYESSSSVLSPATPSMFDNFYPFVLATNTIASFDNNFKS